MSLTHPYGFTERNIKNIIKENIPSKKQFYSTDGTVCFNTKRKCVVPYELDCAYTASVCGTAFDYLARFLIAQKIDSNKSAATETLVAEKILKKRNSLKKHYMCIIDTMKGFINSNNSLDDEIIEGCISLAKMEQVSRTGIVSDEYPLYNDSYLSIKKDLKNLAFSFENTCIPNVKKDSIVVFNPHFGIGSRIVGGADADIYIDGTLYDFKVTKKNGWSSNDVTQIIGYYFLDDIAKKCNDKRNWLSEYKIDKVALYKVRYEEIAYFNVVELDKTKVELAIREMCCCYLMNSLFPEHIDKYNIPLTRRQLIYDCWNQGSEELEWYKKNAKDLSEHCKKRILEITTSQKKLKKYFDGIDVIKLLKEISVG